MKRISTKSFGGLLLCFMLLCGVLQSCGMSQTASRSQRLKPTKAEIQRRLRADYGDALDQAGAQLAQIIQKKIAPSSGKELQHAISLYPISHNEDETVVGCPIEVSFLARDFWAGVGYGTCKVLGTLWLQVPQYRGRPYRVTFQLQNYNDQLQKVSNEAKLKWLNEGIAFDLDLR